MKNRIIGFFLVTILCGSLFSTPVFAKEIPDELKNLYARSAVLMDADSGRILFGKEENAVLPMASTTKIMTCILALENMKTGQICVVSDYAAKQPKVHLGMNKDEKYLLEDLLYSLMLESHNDSAVVIAETIAGSVESFAVLMNKKAQEIGCTDTYFITPNGLDAEDDMGIHSTTAKDLALIMRYCIEQSPLKEEFLRITQTKSYELKDISGKRTFVCNNHNSFLNMMDGALSGKTGFTNNAGYCYVGALRRGDRTFIVTLLACGWPNNKGYKWKDTRRLMQYGLDNYEYRKVPKEFVCDEIIVENGMNILEPLKYPVYVNVGIQEDNSEMHLLMRQDEKVEVNIVQNKRIEAPVKQGQKTGEIFYVLDDAIIKRCDIVTRQSIEERTLRAYVVFLIKEYLVKTSG